jgi:hypothetical protein
MQVSQQLAHPARRNHEKNEGGGCEKEKAHRTEPMGLGDERLVL